MLGSVLRARLRAPVMRCAPASFDFTSLGGLPPGLQAAPRGDVEGGVRQVQEGLTRCVSARAKGIPGEEARLSKRAQSGGTDQPAAQSCQGRPPPPPSNPANVFH